MQWPVITAENVKYTFFETFIFLFEFIPMFEYKYFRTDLRFLYNFTFHRILTIWLQICIKTSFAMHFYTSSVIFLYHNFFNIFITFFNFPVSLFGMIFIFLIIDFSQYLLVSRGVFIRTLLEGWNTIILFRKG